jgi:hypothetical protein
VARGQRRGGVAEGMGLVINLSSLGRRLFKCSRCLRCMATYVTGVREAWDVLCTRNTTHTKGRLTE